MSKGDNGNKPAKSCRGCGNRFTPFYGQVRFCSEACRYAHKRNVQRASRAKWMAPMSGALRPKQLVKSLSPEVQEAHEANIRRLEAKYGRLFAFRGMNRTTENTETQRRSDDDEMSP